MAEWSRLKGLLPAAGVDSDAANPRHADGLFAKLISYANIACV